jgi:two-component system response regulator ChvI
MTQLNEPLNKMSPPPEKERSRHPRRGRIALIDDDDTFVESLAEHLTEEGFDIVGFANGQSAVASLIGDEQVDVVLLDWCLPGTTGLEVLRELRQGGVTAPVILLTGLSHDTYEEAALTAGAVDFIDKARRFSVLVKRIELIADGQRPLPRPKRRQPSLVCLGALELRCDINRAFWNGRPVNLTLTEFRMVFRMALKPGEDVPYRELYDLVHGRGFLAGKGVDGYRTNIRTFIKRIRQKFHEVDSNFDRICNYAGLGYRWVAKSTERITHTTTDATTEA